MSEIKDYKYTFLRRYLAEYYPKVWKEINEKVSLELTSIEGIIEAGKKYLPKFYD